MALYHKDIFLPLSLPAGTMTLTYTTHAKEAAVSDWNGVVPMPAEINLSDFILIEAEIENGLKKILIRGHMDNKTDMCFVIIPNGNGGTVKTVWANRKSDKHKTLDASKYASN